MILFKKMESSEGFLEMDMEREPKSGFRKGAPCGRWIGLLVLLGTVAMVISMVMIFVICGDLVKNVIEVQNSVSSLNLYLNKSSDPMPNGVPEKRLSNIETLVKSFSSSWSSVTSKQDGNLQRLEQHQDTSITEIKNLLLSLSSSVSALTSKLNDAVSKQEQKLTETELLLDSLKTSFTNQQNIQHDFVSEKKLTNIETLLNSFSSSLNSVTSKQDANLQRLEQQHSASITEIKNLLLNLSAVSVLTSKLNDAVNKQGQKQTETEYTLSNSLRGIQSSLSNLTASVLSLSSEQQTTEVRVISSLNELKAHINNQTKSSVRSVPTCRSGWTPYSSSCYLFSTNTLNWMEARDYCTEQGTSLLKLDGSEAEWTFVTNLTKPNNYWIGLTDQTTGVWRWTDGTPYIMKKEHWSVGQPDDWKNHGLGEEGEDCGHLKWSGELNDSHCSLKYRYACKV
ncbi:C-type lectin domain family 10 member A isoform X2 [Triplophysa dalaica]|uniref:C-type lectin domain family 10 member A isoform X2 n=1 Tax=Triplophysa dalaica TaxID=1582913 RepID=UPI0024DF9BF7|nr:C-type lectin domain family 10 member A isoform X2 [Triplophysa dalaica]